MEEAGIEMFRVRYWLTVGPVGKDKTIADDDDGAAAVGNPWAASGVIADDLFEKLIEELSSLGPSNERVNVNGSVVEGTRNFLLYSVQI